MLRNQEIVIPGDVSLKPHEKFGFFFCLLIKELGFLIIQSFFNDLIIPVSIGIPSTLAR